MGLPFILEAPWQVTVPQCGIIEFQSTVVPCTLHASCEDVAAGVPPAVEGGILPPGKTPRLFESSKIFGTTFLLRLSIRRAGRPALRQAGRPPLQG